MTTVTCWFCKKRPSTRSYKYPVGEEKVCDPCYEFLDWYHTNRERLSQDGPEVRRKLEAIGLGNYGMGPVEDRIV